MPAMGSLFQSYDPKGAMNGMFAPAYIHGYAPSQTAVTNWNAAHHPLMNADIESTRMPRAAGSTSQFHGDPRGAVDPEALRVLSQGGQYNMQARRDAIAARVAQNAATPAVTQTDPNKAALDRLLAAGYNPMGGYLGNVNGMDFNPGA